MTPSTARRRFRLPLMLALAVALLAPAAARAQDCANTHLRPTHENLAAVRAAVLCLHNLERARHGLPALSENRRLEGAAMRHTEHMVDARFFDHTSPGGSTMADRIRATGYMSSAHGWAIGENIAWGSGRLGTAAAITSQWMHSAGHRANILNPQFREIGIGIQPGVPARGLHGGATYTTDFGFRR